MPKVTITSYVNSNVVFDFGTVTGNGTDTFDVSETQLMALDQSIKAYAKTGRSARFSYALAGETAPAAKVAAPAVAVDVSKKDLNQMSLLELQGLYRASIGDPGNKKEKKLISELRKVGA